MIDFKLYDEDGNEYTNIKTFYMDYTDNDSFLTHESWGILYLIIWEYIEEYNGDIPDYIAQLFVEIDDLMYSFVEKYEYERITDEFDLYKGWEAFTHIFKNPTTGNYFSLSGFDYANEGPDYVDGYSFTKVKPVEVKNIIWEKDNG